MREMECWIRGRDAGVEEAECWDGRNELGLEQGHAGAKGGECWDKGGGMLGARAGMLGPRDRASSELGNAGMYNQRCSYLLLACCPVGVVLSCG